MDMSPKDRALARKNLALLRQDCWSVYLETKDVVFRCVPFPITESTSTYAVCLPRLALHCRRALETAAARPDDGLWRAHRYFCRDERGYRQIERAGIESCTGAVETKTESTTSAVSGANGIMTALASAHSTTMRYFGAHGVSSESRWHRQRSAAQSILPRVLSLPAAAACSMRVLHARRRRQELLVRHPDVWAGAGRVGIVRVHHVHVGVHKGNRVVWSRLH